MRTIVLFGTLDTKGEELRFLRDRVRARGCETLVVDCGFAAPVVEVAALGPEELARAAGCDLGELRRRNDRGEWVGRMAEGAAAIAAELHRQGRLDGVAAIGGSAGTTIGTAAMRALPVGVPKVMVSTMASGDTRPYVDTKDVCMLYSVVDIAGLNRVSRAILENAAGAICGMVLPAAAPPEAGEADRPLIGATMFGVTTPCVTRARDVLEKAGYEVLVFHATGSGGRALEDLVRSGFLAGVLDITTTELADELVGGVLSAGPERLTAAAGCGIPQVVCPGAIDMVNFGPPDTVPERFAGRCFHRHNPTVTLMRTTPDETRAIGRWTGERLKRARGGTSAVVIPRRGVSALDNAGQPFQDFAALDAYAAGLREAAPELEIRELDLHINDPAFAEECARALLDLLSASARTASP